MLALRPCCEHCAKALPPDAVDARICSFECTFCAPCAEQVLRNVCPNCGGGFVARPIRPKEKLDTRPAAADRVISPVDLEAHAALRERYEHIPPHER